VKFIVAGAPVPKQRPRFNTKTGKVYTPRKTKTAEDHIAWEYRASSGDYPLIDDALDLSVAISFFLAKGQRADIDNLTKTVLDALNGIAWKDDAQVVELHAVIFRDDDVPRTVVSIDVFDSQEEIL